MCVYIVLCPCKWHWRNAQHTHTHTIGALPDCFVQFNFSHCWKRKQLKSVFCKWKWNFCWRFELSFDRPTDSRSELRTPEMCSCCVLYVYFPTAITNNKRLKINQNEWPAIFRLTSTTCARPVIATCENTINLNLMWNSLANDHFGTAMPRNSCDHGHGVLTVATEGGLHLTEEIIIIICPLFKSSANRKSQISIHGISCRAIEQSVNAKTKLQNYWIPFHDSALKVKSDRNKSDVHCAPNTHSNIISQQTFDVTEDIAMRGRAHIIPKSSMNFQHLRHTYAVYVCADGGTDV